MKPKTPKRAAASEPVPVAKSAPVRRSRARKVAEPPSTADDRSTALPEPTVVASEDQAAPPVLTATIAEQLKVMAEQNGSISTDLIARRAYELFLQDGEVHGHDVDHWLAAERELEGTSR